MHESGPAFSREGEEDRATAGLAEREDDDLPIASLMRQGLEARFNYGIGSPPGERGNIGQLLIVDHLPQFFTSFEEGHSFGRNMNTLPCLGVSTIP